MSCPTPRWRRAYLCSHARGRRPLPVCKMAAAWGKHASRRLTRHVPTLKMASPAKPHAGGGALSSITGSGVVTCFHLFSSSPILRTVSALSSDGRPPSPMVACHSPWLHPSSGLVAIGRGRRGSRDSPRPLSAAGANGQNARGTCSGVSAIL